MQFASPSLLENGSNFFMSNILSVFNPPPPKDLPESDCVQCTAIQGVVSVGGGMYMASTLPFTDAKSNKIDLLKHPVWWQRSVRGCGIVAIGFGFWRLLEAYNYSERSEE